MDHRVARLRTPEECAIVAKNAMALKRPDIALEARRKAIEMQVSTHEAANPVETETLAAIYASEAALTHQRGKKTRATRTWEVVRKKGLIAAAERFLHNEEDHAALVELGLEDLSIDALILRHPESFSPAAVEASTARTAERSKI